MNNSESQPSRRSWAPDARIPFEAIIAGLSEKYGLPPMAQGSVACAAPQQALHAETNYVVRYSTAQVPPPRGQEVARPVSPVHYHEQRGSCPPGAGI